MKYRHQFDKNSYDKILNAIFQRFPSVQTSSFKDSYKPGLDGMNEFDKLLGHPHKSYKTIHIAGTNGKGSVANMLASALQSAGYRTGLYTSPHILDFRERMRVDAEMVPYEYVYDFFLDYQDKFDELDLSFFEITTGLAFKWFEDMDVDYAVIETGLGGRLDSTNIIRPELSIITSIGLDHCSMLGNTLDKVAGEKAGIIKKGIPSLVGEIREETRPVFMKKAEEMESTLYFAPEKSPSLWPRSQEIIGKMDLPGEYQHANLKTVLSALDLLGIAGKGRATDEKIVTALEETAHRMHFHGRWETVCTHPHVLCDIGHNAHALKYNFAQLEEMRKNGEFTSLILVYGVMADKNLDAILPLMPEDAYYIFTQADTRRALDSTKLLHIFEVWTKSQGQEMSRDNGKLFVTSNVCDAVHSALQLASDLGGNPLIYIGGSNFIVSEALPLFRTDM